MLLARKLMEDFINRIPADIKEEVYDLAVENIEGAVARCALIYEEIYKDYPTGFMAELILQHLKDKVFQRVTFASLKTDAA